MKVSQQFWRGLVFFLLITALCGGMAVPMFAPANAAPQMQATACSGTTITQWTFTGDVTTPSTGSGTVAVGSGLTSTFAAGPTGGTDRAMSFSGWTTSTSLDVADYVDFAVSTVGRNAIGFSFDYRSTGMGPARLELHYFNGVSFVPFGAPTTLTTDSQFHPLSFDLSTITDLDNNLNMGFRLYGYSAGGGNLRLDNVTINGNCMSPVDLTNTAVVANLTGTVAAGLTGTASDLTSTAVAANLTGTAISNLTGTAVVNQTNTAAANQTGTAFANSTGTAVSNLTNTAFALTNPPATNIVISEFRAIGTSGGNDEFIELFNPSSVPIPIGGWVIKKSTGCGAASATPIATIPSAVTLLPGQHYLIGGSTYSGTVTPDLPGQSLSIANDGGIALLQSASGPIIDQVGLCNTTEYREGAALPQIIVNGNRSYDRKSGPSPARSCVDTNDNLRDFILRTPSDPQNRASALTSCGNPTPTPTATRFRTATPRPSPTRTPTLPPPPQLVAINEFVPRPDHDWNNDGLVNVQDEYIELINHGTIDVNLGGYSLDDEVNIGSSPYSLPSITISPGERIVFYGSETGLLLSDGGDGVRLLRPNGQLMDAYNYFVVRFPDQSYCRLPDNGGADDWNTNCFPTPGLQNALSGSLVSPPNIPDANSLCPIADTLPIDFILAECPPFGNNIWRSSYWDETGWYGERYLPESPGKWPVFVD